MRRCRQEVAAIGAAAVIAAFVSAGAIAAESSPVDASACSVAAGRDASSNIIVVIPAVRPARRGARSDFLQFAVDFELYQSHPGRALG